MRSYAAKVTFTVMLPLPPALFLYYEIVKRHAAINSTPTS